MGRKRRLRRPIGRRSAGRVMSDQALTRAGAGFAGFRGLHSNPPQARACARAHTDRLKRSQQNPANPAPPSRSPEAEAVACPLASDGARDGADDRNVRGVVLAIRPEPGERRAGDPSERPHAAPRLTSARGRVKPRVTRVAPALAWLRRLLRATARALQAIPRAGVRNRSSLLVVREGPPSTVWGVLRTQGGDFHAE